MKPAVTLKLNGKPFNPRPERPKVLTIKKVLDSRKPDEIFTAQEVARLAGLAGCSVSDSGKEPSLEHYSCRIGNTRYWGNPKAIAALKEQLEAGQ